MKFRKKPVIIEAVQYRDQMRKDDNLPEGIFICPWPEHGDQPTIHTLEGDHRVCDGDWIITGVKGEKYPCKPDIFEMTYDPVLDSENAPALAQPERNQPPTP